jgi:glycosyltransferase involved in cell wall biosynthesis
MQLDILLIAYNQEQYIAQAVESILMQRVNEDVQVRVIVADDCSKDSTLEIIKSYEEKSPFPFVYLSAEKNLGISKNYQRAFAACDGDYIAILEGDDWWSSPNHIEQHIRFLDNHKECSMSMNTITLFAQETQELKPAYWGYGDNDVFYVDTKYQITQGNQLGNLSACVLRNNNVKELPSALYDLYIADWMLGVMLSQQGLIGLLRESSSVYRANSNSQWASMDRKRQIKQLLDLSKQYDAFQNGKYHQHWKQYRRTLINKNKRYLMPPLMYKLMKKLAEYIKSRHVR